ncbi:MAG: nicotinamide-nucleotide amidohydrolase family protein, partial [Candidatus Krumholzibacteria bacterium]|nr:nicotinamide-nucleotide amidohydrolase family protein [Candidatus Krumholzibacteria bacterium]
MNKRIEIITIGDEVLRGETQENNGVWISRALIHSGLEPWKITVLPDDMDILVAEFREAAGRSEAIIVTGGLGPTVDDLTKEALIRAQGVGTEIRVGVVEGIAARLKERGREMPAGYRDQGRVPIGAKIIENPVGLAVGLRVGAGAGAGSGAGAGGGEFFLLPGVPAEMQAMFSGTVLPALGAPGIDAAIRLRTFGLMETQVEDALRKVLSEDILKTISIISSPRGADFYIPREPDGAASAEKAERELGSHIFVEGNARLEAVVVGLLVARCMTVATAESLTGGFIASTLISVPGASDTFREGFVVYSNESKMTRLGVKRATLEAHGAVSAEVCVEMAEGARAAAGTDYALSTTGIAGPTGAVPGKPVGLCFVGLAGTEGTFVRKFQFPGDRETVRLRTAYFAIDMLRLALIDEKPRLEPFRVMGARGRE